jgi:hypothetical protein
MSLEKWVEYGWLRREPTGAGEIKDPLGIVIVALRIQRSKPYRPTFDLSQPSTRRSAWRRHRSVPPAFGPLPKRVIT